MDVTPLRTRPNTGGVTPTIRSYIRLTLQGWGESCRSRVNTSGIRCAGGQSNLDDGEETLSIDRPRLAVRQWRWHHGTPTTVSLLLGRRLNRRGQCQAQLICYVGGVSGREWPARRPGRDACRDRAAVRAADVDMLTAAETRLNESWRMTDGRTDEVIICDSVFIATDEPDRVSVAPTVSHGLCR